VLKLLCPIMFNLSRPPNNHYYSCYILGVVAKDY
jgi:hypothetical protein